MNLNVDEPVPLFKPRYAARSRTNTIVEEDELQLLANLLPHERQTMKRKVQSMQERRASRVEALRAQVRSGTYHVDTKVLAQRILENGTHFMEGS